jgi:hypothetical protein
MGEEGIKTAQKFRRLLWTAPNLKILFINR